MVTVPPILVHAALLARLAAPYPFTVGETLRYDAKLGYFPVGEAVVPMNTPRNPTFRDRPISARRTIRTETANKHVSAE